MAETPSAPALDTGSTEYDEKPIESPAPVSIVGCDAKEFARSATDDTAEQVNISPSSQAPSLERWNESRTNINRYFAALYSFIIMGMNDAASGVRIPSSSGLLKY
jgi:hypothetical protein